MRRTKIVATIGPACRDPETLVRMVEAGMDVARLNFSHGSLEEHEENLQRVRNAAGRAGRPVAILQDLPGPKLRLGRLRGDTVELKPGDHITFSCGDDGAEGDENHMSISWGGLAEAVTVGEILYLADGSIRLRASAVRAGARARPSITATQMLDSMVHSSRPTRAEVADVANAILDGTDAVMLSQETAVGAHPVGAVAMMASIARETEKIAPYQRWQETRVRRDARDPAYTLAHSACVAARELALDALVVPTLSGRSARLVSAHRPNVPIFALSPGRETVRRCGLMLGVQAASMRRHEVTEELIKDCVRRVIELGWCKPGQRVGITAGLPSGRPGTTSLVQVQTV